MSHTGPISEAGQISHTSQTSQADLGGQPGHGPVIPEPEGLLWHAAWQPRAMALTVAMGATGAWNIDQSRAARETLADYSTLGYYQVWLAGLQRLLAERGLVRADELAAGHALHPAQPLPRRLAAADVATTLARGAATARPSTGLPRFAVGDAVLTCRDMPPLAAPPGAPKHCRLPAYARGKRGLVERLHGHHVFADANAAGLGEQPQPLYSVVFTGVELWGAGAEPGLQVSIDAWQSYLQVAGPEAPGGTGATGPTGAA